MAASIGLPKTNLRFLFVIASSIVVTTANAFFPPVSAMLKEVCSGRKNTSAIEVVLSHKVRLKPEGEGLTVRERIIRDRGRVLFQWTFADGNWGGSWNGKEYSLTGGKSIASETKAFLRVLLAVIPDELQSVLVAEQFIRTDQLYQYKPGFNFEGDPATWNIKDNYLVPTDMSLKKSPLGIFYSVNGLLDGKNRRSVYFERSLRGVARIEWQSESGTTAWNFSNFTSQPLGGYFPRVLTFESAGIAIVESVLESARALTATQLQESKKAIEILMKAEGYSSPDSESALKILLSFR